LQSAPVDGRERTIIDTGSPYYWSWSPNSHALITHSGGSSTSTTPDHIAFIQLQDSGIIEDGLDTIPGSFQAPAWSPDGSHILLTRLQDGNKEIVLTDKSGTYEKTLATIKLNTAFGWSSDSKHIAFIDSTQTLSAGTIGDLYVVDIDTDKKVSIGKDVVSFYWSPNGEKLAYYVPLLSGDSANNNNNGNNSSGSNSNTQKLLLQLNMLDIKTGKSRELFTYQPSDQFTNTLPYFDQYQQSATIWSPDNNNLVLSFIDSNAKPGIAVVAASGQLQPRILADGYLAFWSWK